jgi:hypothetical protein
MTSDYGVLGRSQKEKLMCSLCGVLGANEHWTDAVARPGIYTRNAEIVDRRRERANRVRVANQILAPFGMRLADWQGTSFVISSRTGKTEMITDLGHLWQAAERLSGKTCDPLDSAVIASVEASRHG